MTSLPSAPAINAVIFDLDGTLADTLLDIARSVNHALVAHGEPDHPLPAYRDMIGAGAENLIRRALREERRYRTAEVLATYGGHYSEHLLDHTRPFAGIYALLDVLVQRGVKLAVLSNKPDAPTKRLVDALFAKYPFSPVFGERAGIPKKPDPTSALEVARLMNSKPERCLFVGDSAIDMATAANAGMVGVGVTWGFRPEELLPSGARHLISTPGALLPLLG